MEVVPQLKDAHFENHCVPPHLPHLPHFEEDNKVGSKIFN